ncbi:hypothetical protein HPB50_006426 [Hyalomma asiaticum]|uniref:Uncharacterized protein n=1 Tax=Hyalomma asiaticum TaxID=266040 RepID=A0ACB7S4R1_HYAAI|nr:hypothetical protein HPB50_006426 [Hyalomma asiaticum]
MRGQEYAHLPGKYSDMLAHCRKRRGRYPPAHKRLKQGTSLTWGRLEAGAYLRSTRLRVTCPGAYGWDCKYCPLHKPSTLSRILMGCKSDSHVASKSRPRSANRQN